MVLSLKNKYFVSGTLILFVFLTNCSDNASLENKQPTVNTNCQQPEPLNPNGDSELSVLMRKMMHTSENLKELIKKGDLPKEFPLEFLKIHTAKPTDSETKKASFDTFAKNYLVNMKSLYAAPKEKLTQNYNNVINACVSCHTEHCPGPLNAINKLKIK